MPVVLSLFSDIFGTPCRIRTHASFESVLEADAIVHSAKDAQIVCFRKNVIRLRHSYWGAEVTKPRLPPNAHTQYTTVNVLYRDSSRHLSYATL